MNQLFFAALLPFFILVGNLSADPTETDSPTSLRQSSEWEIEENTPDWNKLLTPLWVIKKYDAIEPKLYEGILKKKVHAVCESMPKRYDSNAFLLARTMLLQQLSPHDRCSLFCFSPEEQSEIFRQEAHDRHISRRSTAIYHLLRMNSIEKPAQNEVDLFGPSELKLLSHETLLKLDIEVLTPEEHQLFLTD